MVHWNVSLTACVCCMWLHSMWTEIIVFTQNVHGHDQWSRVRDIPPDHSLPLSFLFYTSFTSDTRTHTRFGLQRMPGRQNRVLLYCLWPLLILLNIYSVVVIRKSMWSTIVACFASEMRTTRSTQHIARITGVTGQTGLAWMRGGIRGQQQLLLIWVLCDCIGPCPFENSCWNLNTIDDRMH